MEQIKEQLIFAITYKLLKLNIDEKIFYKLVENKYKQNIDLTKNEIDINIIKIIEVSNIYELLTILNFGFGDDVFIYKQILTKIISNISKEDILNNDDLVNNIKILKKENERLKYNIVNIEQHCNINKNKITKIDTFTNIKLSKSQSKILYSCIKHGNIIISNKLKYTHILTDIWEQMSIRNILNNTIFTFKIGEHIEPGYKYYERIDMSYRLQIAEITLKEILGMCTLNNYKICIIIQLLNSDIIEYNN